MTRARAWLQVGFIPRPRRAPWPAWALLVCGMGLFIAAALDWREADTARADAEQAMQTWQDEQARQRRLAQSPASPTGPQARPAARTDAPAPAKETLRSARRVVDLLEHRWDQLFAALEAHTPPGLQWLRLEHEAEAGEVMLEGVAAEGRLALQVVDTLASQAGWHEVALSRLEAGQGADAAALRFELRARTALNLP